MMITGILLSLLLPRESTAARVRNMTNQFRQATELYNRLTKLETDINSVLGHPLKELVSNLTRSLECFNHQLNLLIIKIKVRDRAYIRSVMRLKDNNGPIFFKHNPTPSCLVDVFDWTNQEVNNFRVWFADTHFLWFLFRRSVKRFNYIFPS